MIEADVHACKWKSYRSLKWGILWVNTYTMILQYKSGNTSTKKRWGDEAYLDNSGESTKCVRLNSANVDTPHI